MTRLARLDGKETAAVSDQLVAVYRAAMAAPPFFESEVETGWFAQELAGELTEAGFRCWVAADGGQTVGFAYGFPTPEVMGIGPTVAVPKVLELTGLTLDDIDLIELNEAFASQTLAVIRELGLDIDKVNVNGGAIALGHPMGATGTKLTIQLLAELARRGGRYGMVTMCVGGGQGAAGIFENLQN